MMKSALSNDGNAILEFFNLQNSEVDKVDLHTVDGVLIADIELVDQKPPCKYCGMDRIRIKERPVKMIKHSNAVGRPCQIRYHAHRYKCLCCGRTYFEHNPFVFKAQKISVLTVTSILEDLKNPAETFSNVAKRYNISPTSVASIFDQHVDMKRLPLPKYMCIDESYSFHSEKSNYVCMFVNFETGDPIDILPSRHMDDLLEYLYVFTGFIHSEVDNTVLPVYIAEFKRNHIMSSETKAHKNHNHCVIPLTYSTVALNTSEYCFYFFVCIYRREPLIPDISAVWNIP